MCLNSSISRFLRGVKLLLSRSGVREKAVCISPDSARKPIPISARPFRGPIPMARKQRLRGGHSRIIGGHSRIIDGHSRIIDKGNYSGCSERVRKPGIQAWDPLFRRVYPLPPGLEWYTPLLGVRRPGRSCVAACLRAHGWPLRVRRVTGPVHTYRGAGRGDGERRVSFVRRARARSKNRANPAPKAGLRVRSVRFVTALALHCVQCT